MNKLSKMVKDNIKGKKHMSSRAKFVYKQLSEQDIPDSLHIPKVQWPRDFTRSLEERKNHELQYLRNNEKAQRLHESRLSMHSDNTMVEKYTCMKIKPLLTTNRQVLVDQVLDLQEDLKVIDSKLEYAIS